MALFNNVGRFQVFCSNVGYVAGRVRAPPAQPCQCFPQETGMYLELNVNVMDLAH